MVGVRVEAEGKKKEMIAKGGEGQRRGEGGGKMQRESIGERERGRERLIVLIPPQAPLGLRPG